MAYDYILAANGLHIRAESSLIQATSPVANARIPGLTPVAPAIHLHHGLIPTDLFAKGLTWLKNCPTTERYFAIVVDNGSYKLRIPEQTGASAHMSYRPPDNAVAEFHSHAVLDAFFSSTDDRDEQGFRIYGVIGQTQKPQPQLVLRLGIFGAFREIPWDDVFTAPTNNVQLIKRQYP